MYLSRAYHNNFVRTVLRVSDHGVAYIHGLGTPTCRPLEPSDTTPISFWERWMEDMPGDGGMADDG